MNVNGNDAFGEVLQRRADEKRTEYAQLFQEHKRMALRLERIKDYLQKVNGLLEAEGLKSVQLKDPVTQIGFARPGNRAKGMPLRKAVWEGISLTAIVSEILNDTQEALHADTIAHRVYEIETETDKRKAKASLISTLRSGMKKRLWDGLGQNVYKGIIQHQPMMAGT